MTALLSIAGCVLLFLGIWGITVTLPTKLLAGYFPTDVQEKLKPRLDNLPMSPKRVLGWVILVLFIAGYIGLFVYAGIDGLRHHFTFRQFFFQHYFPETEGCEGWKNFGYNRKQQIGQCIKILIGSALTAWIFSLL